MKYEDIHDPTDLDDFLNWTSSIICNSAPQSHCSKEDWDIITRKWLDLYHDRFLDRMVLRATGPRTKSILNDRKGT